MIIGNPTLDGENILLLEDEAFVGMAIREFLLAAGAVDVAHAYSAEAALERIRETQFDAAVLDVRLPGGTCYDVAVELTKRNVALVFHSGFEVEFRAAFPNAIVCGKPASAAELIDAIVRAKKHLASLGDPLIAKLD